jgi:hypothetical protein
MDIIQIRDINKFDLFSNKKLTMEIFSDAVKNKLSLIIESQKAFDAAKQDLLKDELLSIPGLIYFTFCSIQLLCYKP